MFEYKFPTFAPGPARVEILSCMADIAAVEQNIRYGGYSDGVVMGCELYEENMTIGVLNGIIKYAGRLYVLKKKMGVPYKPTDAWTVLKVRFGAQVSNREFNLYQGQLVLDEDTQIKPNEMELGRFKLKHGSRLRTKYKDFRDLATEYDTVNLVHVHQASPGVHTLSREITTFFAKEAYAQAESPIDVAFCSQCLAGSEPVRRDLIIQYVCRRYDKPCADMDNAEPHRMLSDILDDITGRSKVETVGSVQQNVMFID